MSVTQTQFVTALMDPDTDMPEGLVDPNGRPAGARFSVYRNNVAVSLTEALQTAFPVIRKLVGEAFFDAMAGVYLRAYPPKSPLLMFYGEDMPEFLEMFDPVKSLPYLPDMARLEVAIRQAYHAADVPEFDPNTLQNMSADQLMAATIQFAPSLRLLVSEWPIHGIWAANMHGGKAPEMQSETLVITRPEFDPQVNRLSGANGRLLAALMAQQPLGAALAQAERSGADAPDLGALLSLLLTQKAIKTMNEGTDHDHAGSAT